MGNERSDSNKDLNSRSKKKYEKPKIVFCEEINIDPKETFKTHCCGTNEVM